MSVTRGRQPNPRGESLTPPQKRVFLIVAVLLIVLMAGAGAWAVAEVAIMNTFLDRNRALATEFLEHEASEPPEWRDLLELASTDYWMTADEVAKAAQALRDVLAPYVQRRRDERPAGSRRVRISRLVVPRTEPAGSARSGQPGPGAEPD